VGTAVAAIVVRRHRRIVDAFRAAGATSSAHPRPLAAIGVVRGVPFDRLHRLGVVRDAGGDEWWLDETRWRALRRTRRRLVVALLLLVLAALAGFLITPGPLDRVEPMPRPDLQQQQ
jgi:hypothetical protein